jgi:hypothetical protein
VKEEHEDVLNAGVVLLDGAEREDGGYQCVEEVMYSEGGNAGTNRVLNYSYL